MCIRDSTGVLLGILLLLIIFAATYFFSGDEPKPAVEETGMYTPGVYNAVIAFIHSDILAYNGIVPFIFGQQGMQWQADRQTDEGFAYIYPL